MYPFKANQSSHSGARINSYLAVALALLATLQISCSQGAPAPPAAPVAKETNAASPSSDDAKGDSKGGLDGLLNGDGKLESDYDVRARQLKQLTDQRASYEYQMTQYQSYRTTLVQAQAQTEQNGLQGAAKGSLGASTTGAAIGVGGAAAIAALSQGVASSSTTGAASASPSLGGVGSAIGAAGTGIAGGIAADDYNKKLADGTKAVVGSLEAQRLDYDTLIANLQAKIAAINAQIDALNAQKLKQ